MRLRFSCTTGLWMLALAVGPAACCAVDGGDLPVSASASPQGDGAAVTVSGTGGLSAETHGPPPASAFAPASVGTAATVVPALCQHELVRPIRETDLRLREPEREEWPKSRRTVAFETGSMPLPITQRTLPDLGFPVHGSVSVGTVADGFLVAGRELPLVGDAVAVFPDYRIRGTNRGTDELVALVEKAAASVAARYPGSILQVANLAKAGGGTIPWSISHKAGRDVDMGFYLVDDQGAQVLLSSMTELRPPLGETEIDGRTCRFDPGRNWALVEALLSDPGATVQYVFVADFLIRRMFDHAVATGASRHFLEQLRPILRQPRGTRSHNDHFHVRVACSTEDRLDGCRDIVAGAEIVPVDDPAWQERVSALMLLLDQDPDPARQAAAASRLGHLKARGSTPAVLRFLRRCEDPHCLGGLQALASLGRRPPPDLLVDVAKRSLHLDTVRTAFRLLRRQKPAVAGLVVPLLSDPRVLVADRGPYEAELTVRREACLALGWIGSLTIGDALAPLLADPEVSVRTAALWALRSIAAAVVFPDGILTSPPAQPAADWTAWRKTHKDPARNLVESMKALGYPVRRSRPEPGEARLYLKAILDVDHLSLNAQRALNSMFDRNIAVRLEDKADPHWLWNRELSRLKRSGRGKR